MAVGQSTLIGDIGGSGALYRNMARIIMGTEGLAFINNSQFVYRGMKAHKHKWERQLFYLQEHGRRYGLIVPPSNQGLPFVAEIPILPKPLFKPWVAPEPERELTPEEIQLEADLAVVRANMDRLIYHPRKGKARFYLVP